jgi:VWFA-related protein
MQFVSQGRVAILLFSLFLANSLSSASLSAADDAGYTFRTNADMVQLVFSARDHQGHAIKTLLPSDIAVVDNGSIIRHFRSFQPTAESPLDIVILLDASDSVASQIPEEISAVEDFIRDSDWGGRDRISILAFGGRRPRLLCARNCIRDTAAAVKLNTLRANGLTPLYDALYQASELLRETLEDQSRPAMILFSDGEDTVSRHTMYEALRAAQNIQSAIYSVSSRSKKFQRTQGDVVLNYLAAGTGGLSFAPGENVKDVLRSVVEDMHSGYVLTYDLPGQMTGQHSVRILPTRDPRLQFRSRQGYRYRP